MLWMFREYYEETTISMEEHGLRLAILVYCTENIVLQIGRRIRVEMVIKDKH